MALLSVKVFYIENKATKEIRKFNIEGDVSENFEYLTGKIRQAFPDLLRKDLELFWKGRVSSVFCFCFFAFSIWRVFSSNRLANYSKNAKQHFQLH